MRHVNKKLKLCRILIDIDNPAFEDPCKYYEAGTDWKKLSEDEIPPAYMMQWSIESSKSYAWHTLGPVIAMDVLEAEVHRQYPGRWQGPFDLGERGIRFWEWSRPLHA